MICSRNEDSIDKEMGHCFFLKKVPIRGEDAAFFISVGKIREEAQSTLAGLRKRDMAIVMKELLPIGFPLNENGVE